MDSLYAGDSPRYDFGITVESLVAKDLLIDRTLLGQRVRDRVE